MRLPHFALLAYALEVLAHDAFSNIVEIGSECQAPLLSSDTSFTCMTEGTALTTEFDEHERDAKKRWTTSTPCARNGSDSIFCVYTDANFANGRGITFLTTPKRAEKLGAASMLKDGPPPMKVLNPAEDPRWIVQPIASKDMGVVAVQRFEIGDRIMSATPSIMVDYDAFEDLDKVVVDWLQASGVDSLPYAHRTDFLNLSTHHPVETHEERVSKILATNAFDIDGMAPIDGKDEDEEYSWYTVFPHISRFNHDCRPNADYRFDPSTLTQHIHAVRPILPGEEITLSYIGLFETRATRRSRLERTWHFNCTCSLCTQDEAQAAASDARIRQIENLRTHFSDWTSASKVTTQMAELMVSLYEEERMWAGMYEAYAFAALEWNGIGEPWLATKYARLAIQHGLAVLGSKDKEVWDMKRLARDPWDHWSWMLRTRVRMNWPE
ncbi:hypothetical protein F5Y16DRAFT_395664 [Xylariaceae sp. FL0255]|nr:hypothetical protein F5Y16DRAFT_395664 [Xylariaceae sp. FL0255]